MAFESSVKQKHLKPITLSNQERIVLASDKTKERLLVVDFFKDVLTSAVNSESRGVLQQTVLSLRENTSEMLIHTLEEAKKFGGISADCAVDADKIIEHLIGTPPQIGALGSEEFCQLALSYLDWKKDNDEIMMQLFRDAYVHDRGMKKGILLEVSIEAAALLEQQEGAQAKPVRLDAKQSLKNFILENLKMSSDVDQDQLEKVKAMVRLLWPGMTGDLSQTDLYKKIGGNLAPLDREQVLYWNGYLSVRGRSLNYNKPLWFDCRFQDCTQEASAKYEKATELLIDDLNESHLNALVESVPEAVEGPAFPDDSKNLYGACHKISFRDPIRLLEDVSLSELNLRLTMEAPKPESDGSKVDYYPLLYSLLPDPQDLKVKQTLGFNEFLLGSFEDPKSPTPAIYIVRTRSEGMEIAKTYPLLKLYVCAYSSVLKKVIPPKVLKDERTLIVERMTSFLAQNRGKAGGVLSAMKAKEAAAVGEALVQYIKDQPTPDGQLAYELRCALKKVLSRKMGIQAAKQQFLDQKVFQDKLLIQTQNEIKTNQTAQRIQAFKTKLALQIKLTLQAKKDLENQLSPLLELVAQAVQSKPLKPKAPPKAPAAPKSIFQQKPTTPSLFEWEKVIPWEKLVQLAEYLEQKVKSELPEVKLELKLPEANAQVTDRNLEDLITFFYDVTVKSTLDPVAKYAIVMAEFLADYVGALDDSNRAVVMDLFARLAEELSSTVT